ncbi:MAG TPA: LamG-like jellyroll fold domain-containing protein [Candidatus Saccharimonadales bacterium]|nr:LamG-like jellyroll fold domain-containing protein [Candidatus Saccharimonadales bacterium]
MHHAVHRLLRRLHTRLHPYVRVARRLVSRWYRRLHHHLAHRPHEHLRSRWKWYGTWHTHRLHGRVHGVILGVELVLVAGFFVSMVRTTLALSDVADSWTFSQTDDYTPSAGIELTGSSARLKAQNYPNDGNTAALFHLDESSGTIAADSSSNGNTAAITQGTFGTGNLNNGLDLNGATSELRAPDSPSLSLTQQNSLEAWTKLRNNLSPGSATQRQSILDKGDYQLYYDNETGKVTYELASDSATSWARPGGNDSAGGWDLNGKRSVNATVKIGSDIYVGIGADIGDAEVWKWNGTTWSLIGGGPEVLANSWEAQTYEGVYALATDGVNIYAGLGASTGDGEVWRYNGTAWTKIGGDAVNGSWGLSTYEYAYALDYFNGTLYAGLGSSANDAEVWSWNGTTWTKIGGDSVNAGWVANYELVASLTNDGTNLYAGLGASAGDGEVWRWNGTAWTKIGGDSVNSGWDNTIETVRTLRYLGSTLYAGLGDSAGDAEVWEWNGTAWTKVGGDALSGSWNGTSYEQIGSFAYNGGKLYVGLGTSDGDGEVWELSAGAWTKIGGDALAGSWASASGDTVNTLTFSEGILYAGLYDTNNGGSGWMYSWDGTNWTLQGGNYVNKSWGYSGAGSVQVMQHVGQYMYAGMGSAAGSALVWRYDGSRWELIGGQGVNGSWAPNAYEQVMSMASYGGKLYVGLGASANDAEVWEWNGTTWTKIGGDSVNAGWGASYEEVSALASHGGYLYAGLGASANDAEVWRYEGTTWTRIGGDSVNSGWTTNFERVSAFALFEGRLVAGLGASAGDGEVWQWSGSAWTRIGGDGVNSSWANTTYEQVETIVPYNGKLYVGLGASTDDAEVWEWNGTTWTKVGGDDVGGSWASGTYERVKSLVVYNGDLYAGLGNTAGDGEVWQWNGTAWTRIAGNAINAGWGASIEQVESFSVFQGKLYAGLGNTANADAYVYSWGNNAYLQSTQSTFDTQWHHIAATYDGATMKLYIDGVLNSSAAANISMPDGSRPLLIGRGYGSRESGKAAAALDGQLDEIRISTSARTTFTSKPYPLEPQTISLATAARKSGIWHWDAFADSQAANGGLITYRLSDDNGTTWKYWDGNGWVLSASVSDANPVADVSAHIATFPVTFSGLMWQAVLDGNGHQQVTLQSVALDSTSDTVAPSVAGMTISAAKVANGSALADNGWTNGSSPAFTWNAATDADAGIKGYCAYLGHDATADPISTKGMLGTSPLNPGSQCQFLIGNAALDLADSSMLSQQLTTSSTPYYLRIKAIDNAGNVSDTTRQFRFRFDNTLPANPGFITSPSGFVNDKAVTLSWPTAGGAAPSDANAGLAGLQYRIGSTGTWYGDSHTGTGDVNDLLANDGSYTTQPTPDFDDMVEGINTVYFRVWDNAGNVTTSYVTGALKINTAGAPSEPQNITATPPTNSTNSFAFSWDAPTTFVGSQSALTYCYSFNVVPSATNCTFTSPGVTSLGAGPYATQPGSNTIYMVAKDESGNINYESYGSATFTANTPAPGMPLNLDIVDVSIKATNNWRLALTWDEPTFAGAGIATYKVYRSTDNATYSLVGSSSSTTYIDAGLTQQEYSYRMRACDSTNNCGAMSSSVSDTPTGKFTNPAAMVAEPTVTDVTTKKATVRWSTDRASDSKIAIGTTSGRYSSSEISSSQQVSAHQIDLDNLAAGTTYYIVAKWTDEDGNTGTSQEYSFTTAPPPSLKEITTLQVGLTDATLQFSSKNATRVAVYYGKSEGFGGLKTINTSTAESTYNVELIGLDDGAKYFYQLVSYDAENNAYSGSVFSFNTVPRPRISNLTFQPVPGEPTSTQKVTWTTNVPSTSTVSYGIVGTPGHDSQNSQMTLNHEITIRDLEDDSQYFLVAQSRDADGNLAVSERQVFHTALDTRPPKISNITVEASIRGSGSEARGQVVVSWTTDEPATSQVAYAEGSDVQVFNSRTAEDSALSFEHIVIVSDLPTSKVYSIQPVSADKSGNDGVGEIQSAIIGRASDNVLTIVLTTLKNVFGF